MTDLIYDGDLAIRRTAGTGTGILYLHGYASDMAGTKSAFLADWAIQNEIPFTRFDMRGHGLSRRDFSDFTLHDWLEDCAYVLENHTDGEIVLVGSSMGGWLSLLLAEKYPSRIKHMIGIAAAPDFVKYIPLAAQKIDTGYVLDNGLHFTENLIETGHDLCLLDRTVQISVPITLLHGKKDDSVPWQRAEDIKAKLPQAVIHYVDDADHRFSRPQDLEILIRATEVALI